MGAAVITLLAGLMPGASLKPGAVLPDVSGETLTGRVATLPGAARGKVTLIVFSFSREAGAEGRAWTERFVRDFGSNWRVWSFSVIVLQSVPGLLRGVVVAQIRKGTPIALRDRVLLVYREEDAWKRRLGVSSDKDVSLLLIGADGTIRWVHHGRFSEPDYARLAAELVAADAP